MRFIDFLAAGSGAAEKDFVDFRVGEFGTWWVLFEEGGCG